jgi:hypothetical protein
MSGLNVPSRTLITRRDNLLRRRDIQSLLPAHRPYL